MQAFFATYSFLIFASNPLRSTGAQPLPSSSLTWAHPRTTDFASAPFGNARTPPKSSGPTAPPSSCSRLASTPPGPPAPRGPKQPRPRSQNAAWRTNSFLSSSSPSWPWPPSSSRSPSSTSWSNEPRCRFSSSKLVWFVDVCFCFFISVSGTSFEEPLEGKDGEKEVVDSLHPIYRSIFLARLLRMLSKERRSLPDRLGDLLKDQQRSLPLVAYSSYHFIYLCSCSLYVIYTYNFSCKLSSVNSFSVPKLARWSRRSPVCYLGPGTWGPVTTPSVRGSWTIPGEIKSTA